MYADIENRRRSHVGRGVCFRTLRIDEILPAEPIQPPARGGVILNGKKEVQVKRFGERVRQALPPKRFPHGLFGPVEIFRNRSSLRCASFEIVCVEGIHLNVNDVAIA